MNDRMITIRTQYCTNCGISGHNFHHCLSPVTSYGIIAIRFPDCSHISSLYSRSLLQCSDAIQFLLIQRKDSLSFTEFVRGKFSHLDEDYMSKLLRGMTQTEQERILTRTFDQLWNDIWGETSHLKSHKNNYEISEKRFTLLGQRLHQLIKENPTKWTEPEWGFPKGRRNPYESDINCAIREFQEETGLERSDFTMVQNTQYLSEIFYGSNNIHYCHKYYMALCNQSVNVELNRNNLHMTREIGAINWFSLDDAITRIRPDNIEKREVLLKAGKIMKNFYPIYTAE
jgi:8-oxo-dGTP pyrophosphatase MutT (NUDIX family)